jgi:histidine ammonia-lyase
LAELEQVFRGELPVKLDRGCKASVERAAAQLAAAAAGDVPVYGVNTGFGKLASLKIEKEDTATLQRNLIISHCCGVGEAIPRSYARLIIVLKLLSLGRGASGVRWSLIELLEDMLEKGVTPTIPAQGSVGASGDLAPLAHMTAVIIGEGEAEYQGEVMSGAEALAKAGLSPIRKLRNSRESPQWGQPCAGPVLYPLPATSYRCRNRYSSPGCDDAGNRGERGNG